MFIIDADSSIDNGLEPEEIKKALCNIERRCGKRDPNSGDLVVLCTVGDGQKVMVAILEFQEGQEWWVVLAEEADAEQRTEWEECIESSQG